MPIQREKTIEELMGGTRGGTPAPFVFNPDTASGRSPYQQQYGETTAQWRARTARPISPTGIDPAESAYLRTTGYDPNAPPPTAEQSYSSTLSMFQQQINALDMEVARKRADIQNRYNVIGQGRLGSQRAIQAQTGMLGQVGGFQQQQKLERANLAESEAAVAEGIAPLQQRKSALFGTIREIATEDLRARTEAATLGAEKFLQYKKERKEGIKSKVSLAIKAKLLEGIELDENDFNQYATELGISSDEVKDTYTVLKKEAEAADAKAKADALKSQPNVVREYEYAKNQGYEGSFSQYQNEDANRKRSSSRATEPEIKRRAISGMSSELNVVKGTDGFISPEDWKTAKRAWLDKGLGTEDFIENFFDYINPERVGDYGIREKSYF